MLGRTKFGLSVANTYSVSLRSLRTSQSRRKDSPGTNQVPEIADDPIQMMLMQKIKDFRGQMQPPSNDACMSKELKAELDKIDKVLLTSTVMSDINVQNADLGEKTLEAEDKIIPDTFLNSQDSESPSQQDVKKDKIIPESVLSQDSDKIIPEAILKQDSDESLSQDVKK